MLRKQKSEIIANNFQLFVNKNGKYQWRKLSHNHHVMAESFNEYSRRIDCVKNAKRFGLDDTYLGTNDKWEFDKKNGKSYWVRKTPRGKIVGKSNLFSRITDCVANARKMGYAYG